MQSTKPFDPMHLESNSTRDKLALSKSNWALPLDKGPFVAYNVTVGITFTYGEVKTDVNAQPLNSEELSMSGLWAIGEMQGGIFYHNYPLGANLTKGAVFAQIAGKLAGLRARTSKAGYKPIHNIEVNSHTLVSKSML